MENVGLKIELTAETSKATKGIEAVNKSLLTMPAAANKAGASLDKMGKASGSAGLALTNLGRVAQDAPFGFIGIANNLNPLLESFQRLKSESGGVGGALKALAGSLMGVGGLGLALSAFQFFALGGVGALKKMFGAANETKKSFEDLEKAITDFSTTTNDFAGKQLAEADSLIRSTQNVTLSLKERGQAVDDLQKKFPAYFGALQDEDILAGKLGNSYEKLKNDILAAARARAAQDILGQLAAKELSILIKRDAAQANLNKETAKFAKEQELVNAALAKSGKLAPEVQSLLEGFGLVNNALNAKGYLQQQQAVSGINKELKELQQQQQLYIKYVDEGAGATLRLDASINKIKPEKVAKAAKEIKEAVLKIRDTIREGIASSDPQNQLIFDAVIKFKEDQAKAEVKKIQEFVNTVNGSGIIPTVTLKMDANIQAVIDTIKKAQDDLIKRTEAFRGRLKEMLSAMAADLVGGIAEGIGKALAGEGNPFAGLLTILGNGLESLGKMVIATFVTLEALQKILNSVGITNPAVGIAIGASMVALGSLIKSKVSQTKFATGGIVTGPTNALIGEAGPEVVFPLSKLDSFLSDRGGSAQPVVLQTVVRGQDILLVQQRASASYKRTNG